MHIKEYLKRLSEASGVSGYEADVRGIVHEQFTALADQVTVDTLGNLIALKRGGGEDPRRSIMLAGHMDEIGLLVTKQEKGFLRFTTVGGFDDRVLLGQEVWVHGRERLCGVIGSRPPHVLGSEEREKIVPRHHLFVDVGRTEEELRTLVRVGDVITVKRSVTHLTGGRMTGKAFDDRAAVACIFHCLQLLASYRHAWDVYAVATVQEETGLKGALVSAFGIAPDVGIAIDVGHGDMSGVPESQTVKLGGGPALGFGPNIHPLVHERLVETAKAYEIDYQVDPIPGRSGTDAWAIQVAREGIPTGLISIPLRYMHTSVETLVVQDLERIGRLLAHLICGLDDSFATKLGLPQKTV